MQLRFLVTFAVNFGFWIAWNQAAPAQIAIIPSPAKSREEHAVNQKLADAVVRRLLICEEAVGADLDVLVSGGAVTLSGSVLTEERKRAILEIVRAVERVEVVKDFLVAKPLDRPNVPSPSPTQNAAADANVKSFKPQASGSTRKVMQPEPAEKAFLKATPTPLSTTPRLIPNYELDENTINRKFAGVAAVKTQGLGAANADIGIAKIGRGAFESPKRDWENGRSSPGVKITNEGPIEATINQPPTPQVVLKAQSVDASDTLALSPLPNPSNGNSQVDPLPIGSGRVYLAPTPLPSNVGPSSASPLRILPSVGPVASPSNALPLIGPYYPDPKVPLGWRTVTLEWQDGHWWLGRKQAPIDYWRSKFGY